jgi:hypothetical protein
MNVITLFPDPPFVSQETLRAWQEKNHPWLELSDVHKETTENVRVTVIPFYMGYRENQNTNVYWVSIRIQFTLGYNNCKAIFLISIGYSEYFEMLKFKF